MSDITLYAPSLDGRLVRPRLVTLLRERFERRLVRVIAPAGFGKTTAILQAIDQNRVDPHGEDVWVTVTANDDDNDVLNRLYAFLQMTDVTLDPRSVEDICAAVLAKAPTEVALVIDDLHFGAESVIQVVRELVKDLPSNGHVVVGSRSNESIASARLISGGHVASIDADTLAFNADEVSSICEQHAVSDVGALGAEARWPAQLALALQADRSTQTRYLAEEIIEQMEPDRRSQLAELSVIGAADDAFASRVTAGSVRSVGSLVAGLPLVDRFPDSRVALHDLWIEALRPHVDDGRRSELLAAGSRALIDKGSYVEAMEMSLQANDLGAFRDAARLEAERPTTEFSLSNIRRCIDLLDHTELTALQQYFRAVEVWSVRGATGMPQRLLEIANQAGQDGEAHLEALFLYRALQSSSDLGGQHGELYERVMALPDSNDPQVQLTKWSLVAGDALRHGRIDELLDKLEQLDDFAAVFAPHFRAMFYTDAGRPELVTGDALRDDMGVTRELARTMELFVAQAAWLRGDAAPELAIQLSAAMGDRTSGRGLATQVVPQAAVFVIVGAAAGDQRYVENLLDGIARTDPKGLGSNIRSFVHIAPGWAAAAQGNDESAIEHLAQAMSVSPIAPWPYRSWMYALVPLYVLFPEQRPALDALDLGPSLSAVLDAARAIVALRDSGATQSAAKLRWAQPNLLRAHVPVAMLVEACVAGTHAGSPEARKLLGDLPDPGTHLLALAGRSKGAVAKLARQLAQSFPKRPAEPLRVRFLGPVELERSGQFFDPPEWRRSRVQELLAFLLLNPSISRAAAASAIWSDLDDDAAQNNLRVHLSYLAKVLEPDRERGAPPWFIRSRADGLLMHTDGLETDMAELVTASNAARAADTAGIPSESIQHHNTVVELFRGDLIETALSGWVDFDRIELRSRAVASLVRLGELSLASGEPEAARDWARRALDIEPFSQQGIRLYVRALRGGNDVAAARLAATAFLAKLAEQGLNAEPETQRLFGA